MNLNRLVPATFLCCLVIGCSGEKFASDADELEYLSSLAQPSVAQHHRKKELMLKAERATLEREKATEDRLKAEYERTAAVHRATDALLERDRLAREKEIETNAEAALKEAGEWADRHAGSETAGDHYRQVIEAYPATSQAFVAGVRLKELESR